MATAGSVKPSALQANPKVEQIMLAASKLFLTNGFNATSMDAVAKSAGVSKATLYAYFTNKKELFSAIITNFAARHSLFVHKEKIEETKNIREVLEALGRTVLLLTLSSDVLAAHRMVMAEVTSAPEIGQMYYDSGPAHLIDYLELHLKYAMKHGLLREAPARLAAEQFISLVRIHLQFSALMRLKRKITEQEKNEILKSGVDVFYRAYQPE